MTAPTLLTLAEHTIAPDLLPERPIVFDIGCRWFSFASEVKRIRPGARVVCFDPDPLVAQDLKSKEFEFWQNGIVGRPALGGAVPGSARLYRYLDGVSDFIDGLACEHYYRDHKIYSGDFLNVSTMSIDQAMRAVGVSHLDVVKLDCECSEFSILEDWPGPIATQISVEFHDWADRVRWSARYFEQLFAGPLRDYAVVAHQEHGSYAHTDSLLILRSAL